MHLPRRLTEAGVNPLDQVQFEKRSSVITNPDGSVGFEMDAVEVPKDWSQLATDIVVSKYFRKAGVPGTDCETSVRQVVTRVARTIREAGEGLGGYFDSAEDAYIIYNNAVTDLRTSLKKKNSKKQAKIEA